MAGTNFFDFHERQTRRKADAPPAAGGDAITVSQLTAKIERAIKTGLPDAVLVKGEVSNCKHHGASGHIYLTLKDANACIDCVMFRSDAARLKFVPEDGMELLATGRVAVYPQRGRYQLYVTRLEPLGQGALEMAFRQLCAKLEAEGLFAAERKKPLPRYPQTLALVTSTQTAAVQDMLKVLRRFPWVRVMVYHVPVQGDGSAEKIAAALTDLNRWRLQLGVELILLGRGGGSLEDLWEFNEEIVARAVCASGIPVITGIGHEVDVSIADLVADYHAHTPTEAAQVAMAQWRTARDTVDQAGIRLRRELRTRLDEAKQRLTGIARHEAFRRPMDRVNSLRQLLDDRQRALSQAISGRLAESNQRVLRLAAMLGEQHPRHRVALARQKLSSTVASLVGAMQQRRQRWQQRVESLAAQLNALSPAAVLKRGYSMTTRKKDGAIVRSPEQVKPGERLLTRLADGQVESVVEDARQMRLFE